MRFVCTTALTWKGFCLYKTRYKVTKICRIWVGYFLICMCCCSIKFTLKARSAISWIHIHKLLNASQWSYISWSKKKVLQWFEYSDNEKYINFEHSCAANCSFTCISFNCFRIGVTGTDNGICLQKTFPIWTKKLNQMIKERHCHANRAVISLITAAP